MKWSKIAVNFVLLLQEYNTLVAIYGFIMDCLCSALPIPFSEKAYMYKYGRSNYLIHVVVLVLLALHHSWHSWHD